MGPDYGNQACNDIGYGRMTDPKLLTEYIIQYFSNNNCLNNFNIMITVGPTHEALDSVRFFINYSSGKMGFAMEQAASDKGANVILISGPVYLNTPLRVQRINVITVLEMKEAVLCKILKIKKFLLVVQQCQIIVFFCPSVDKIKKDKNFLKITMVKNLDIVAEAGSLSEKRPYVVGFSADTKNIKEYAQSKCINKNLDLICANNVFDDYQRI